MERDVVECVLVERDFDDAVRDDSGLDDDPAVRDRVDRDDA